MDAWSCYFDSYFTANILTFLAIAATVFLCLSSRRRSFVIISSLPFVVLCWYFALEKLVGGVQCPNGVAVPWALVVLCSLAACLIVRFFLVISSRPATVTALGKGAAMVTVGIKVSEYFIGLLAGTAI